MGDRKPNYFPDEAFAASQLLTRFMHAYDVIWDDDQSDCEIHQAAHAVERRLGLAFDEARELVIHTVLSDKGPAAIIPAAACMDDGKRRPAKALKIHAPAV